MNTRTAIVAVGVAAVALVAVAVGPLPVGTVELDAVQALVPVQASTPSAGELLSGLNWFTVSEPAARTDVRVTLDGGADDIRAAAPGVLDTLRGWHTGAFAFGEVSTDPGPVVAPEPAVVDDLWLGEGRHPVTFTATVPEWTLDAVSWAVAAVAEAAWTAGTRTSVLVSVARGSAGV